MIVKSIKGVILCIVTKWHHPVTGKPYSDDNDKTSFLLVLLCVEGGLSACAHSTLGGKSIFNLHFIHMYT